MEKSVAKTTAAVLPVSKQRVRTSHEEIKILISMIDCLVLDREAVYASSEFTSGRRFYALCEQYGVRTGEELKARLGPDYASLLLTPNREQGVEFARSLRRFGHEIVLTPHPLLVPDWSQPEYLAFWEKVISGKCRAVYFNEEWEFSNGCSFEYLVGLNAGLPVLDHNNRPIPAEKARELIHSAIEKLEKQGFVVAELRRIYDQLTSF